VQYQDRGQKCPERPNAHVTIGMATSETENPDESSVEIIEELLLEQ